MTDEDGCILKKRTLHNIPVMMRNEIFLTAPQVILLGSSPGGQNAILQDSIKVDTNSLTHKCRHTVCTESESHLDVHMSSAHTCRTHARTHTRTHARTHAHARTRTCARTHTHTRTHARTHTHTCTTSQSTVQAHIYPHLHTQTHKHGKWI